MDQQRSLDVNWIQVLAGALAATSSAVLLSTVGVAGTIIGAAAGSVAATVGSAVYSYYLAASRERVLAARSLTLGRVTRAQLKSRELSAASAAERARAEQETGQAPERPREAEAGLDAPVTWRKILGGLRWKRIALVSLSIFVLVMAAILVFELMAGRAVSTYTGGTGEDGPRTTIPWGRGDDANDQPKNVPTRSGTDSDTPSDVAPTETTPESDQSTVPAEPSTTGATPEDATTVPPTSVPPTADQTDTDPSASTSTVAPTGQLSP